MAVDKNEKSLKHIFGSFHRSDFTSLHRFFDSAFFGWLVFAALVFAISFILSFQIDYLPPYFKVGRVAPKDLKADQNYEIEDETTTGARRQEAYHNVLPVYNFDENVSRDLDQQIRVAFQESRKMVESGQSVDKIGQFLLRTLGVQPTDDQLEALIKDNFSADSENLLKQILAEAMAQKIVSNRAVFTAEDNDGITIRNLQVQSPENEMALKDLALIHSVEEVQNELVAQGKQAPKDSGRAVSLKQLYEIASRLIRPNLSYDPVETEVRRVRAMKNVPPTFIKVQAGEMIIRAGDRYDAIHLTKLEGIRKQKSQTNLLIKSVGTAIFVSLLLLITYAFSKRYIRKFSPSRKDLYFLGAVLLLLLGSVRLSVGLAAALKDLFPFDVSVQVLYYAIPVAAGAMLTRYLLNSEIALVFAIVASALTGIFLEGDLDLSIYYLISSITAASAMAHVESRSSILRAGVMVGLANAGMVLAIKLVNVFSVTNVFNVPYFLINMGLAFFGGLLCSIFVMVLAPIAEMVFNYVTDIKLLELGNLNHPLLREMIVKAPGTYHHSQLVAVLAEAGAAEIGANPLLARVGSYFHDIGKMRKPAYFIENQQGGENRHDRLTPSMSALIIASHVKDGLELAKDYKLPSRIAEFIPQHQGTKLITFFYNKAVEQNADKDTPVDEKKYRYPGPRPQTREAGIILLADGVEASVRSLGEKNPQRIQGMVTKIINKNFSEEQLDECDLTLKDLHGIAETFTRVLIGIYHQRIEYPEMEEKKATVTPLKEIKR